MTLLLSINNRIRHLQYNCINISNITKYNNFIKQYCPLAEEEKALPVVQVKHPLVQ